MTEQDPVDAWVAEALREVRREEELTQEEAVRALSLEGATATSDEVSPADIARIFGETAARPARNTRQQDLQRAKEVLGVEGPPQGMKSPWKLRMYYRTVWRYKAIAQCRRVQDQMRIVAYLEERLTGKETELPVDVAEAVQKLVEHSRKHPLEWIPPTSSRQQYEHLADAYRRYKAKQQRSPEGGPGGSHP